MAGRQCCEFKRSFSVLHNLGALTRHEALWCKRLPSWVRPRRQGQYYTWPQPTPAAINRLHSSEVLCLPGFMLPSYTLLSIPHRLRPSLACAHCLRAARSLVCDNDHRGPQAAEAQGGAVQPASREREGVRPERQPLREAGQERVPAHDARTAAPDAARGEASDRPRYRLLANGSSRVNYLTLSFGDIRLSSWRRPWVGRVTRSIVL